jgi:hypothetical protein
MNAFKSASELRHLLRIKKVTARDRLGPTYRFSSSGDLKGISFIFRTAFER